MALGNWPQLYAESLADVSDVTEEIGGTQGGYYDAVKLVATVGSKWIGVPWTVGGGLIAYRKSWFEDVGYKTFPETWDALRDAGKKLKANGRPLGQTAGHTFGDAPAWWYPYLWSWGGKEVEADGKTVVLNTGCDKLAEDLHSWGYQTRAVELDEFLKAGGSAKCLTLRLDGEEAAVWD